MVLLNIFEITLPLKNPVLLFSLLLFIILFAPLILNKLKIPYLIGLIIAGAIIGPNGLNLMLRDSSIVLFGTVGLLYIMFLAGLEIDLIDFKKNRNKSVVFGLYTFFIPLTIGFLVGHYFLHYSILSSVLLAAMFSSHTLIAYPIVSKLGVARNRAVNITIGGTLITDTLALLVLAAVAGMAKGEITNGFWLQLSISVFVFGMIILFIFPIIGRWFFKRFHDNISQYIFVLAMLFLGAFLAEEAGIEAIIGAFLVGLALNRVIPRTSALMNRIEFVGNALFIPFFLIGVGMLIDYRIFFKGFETIKVALTMIIVASTSKFLAAWLTQKTYKFSDDERRLIFGLSNAHVAATLAVVLVGYNIILNSSEIAAAATLNQIVEPIRLLNENVLNGTILMILVTCTVASFVTQKGAKNIAVLEASNIKSSPNELEERILISAHHTDTIDELINLSVTIKSKSSKNGLFALFVIENEAIDDNSDKKAKKILHQAAISASATDHQLFELLRYDISIANGIIGATKEHRITDLIIGVSKSNPFSESFKTKLLNQILIRSNTTTIVYKSLQPLSTIKRHLIFVPERAEKEIGFPFWLIKAWNIARNTGATLVFYAFEQTLNYIQDIQLKHPIASEFIKLENWDDFLTVSKKAESDDNLIFILSRKNRLSYHANMSEISDYLTEQLTNNYMLVYPIQADNSSSIVDFSTLSALEPFEKLDTIGDTILNLFKKK